MVDGRAPLAPPRWAPPVTAPAGWYSDPWGQPLLRYFDGQRWTFHTAPVVAPTQPHRQLPIVVAIGALAVLLVSLIASRILLEHIVQFGWPIIVYVTISVVLGYGPSVWWCWYATGRWGHGNRRDDLGLRFRWSDLGWGPIVWLSAVVAEGIVAMIVTGLHIPLTSNTEGVGELRLDRTYVISILVTAVVAAPIVEETVFRGLILPGLLSRMQWVPAVDRPGPAVRDGARRPGTRGRQHRAGADPRRGRRRARWRGLPAAADRADDAGPRHPQRGGADHRPAQVSAHGRTTATA